MNMSKTTRPMAGPCANRLRHNQLMIRGQKGLRLHRFPKDLLESPGKIWRPSGKHTKNYGKSPCLMGKSTISTGPFSIAM